jgi:hypothetical protein
MLYLHAFAEEVIMKIRLITVYSLVSLSIIAATTAFAAGSPSDAAPAVIDRVEKLAQNQQPGVDNSEGQAPSPPPADPAVGRWQCTNNLQTVNLTILRDGQFLVEEPTMGTVRRNTWARLDDTRISVYGGTAYEITFDGPDSFTLLNVGLRTTVSCQRQ